MLLFGSLALRSIYVVDDSSVRCGVLSLEAPPRYHEGRDVARGEPQGVREKGAGDWGAGVLWWWLVVFAMSRFNCDIILFSGTDHVRYDTCTYNRNST